MHPTIELSCQLIEKASLTPNDAGCMPIIAERLQNLGFTLEWLNCKDTTNLWATWGNKGPHLVFAGHTDVVPEGPKNQWQTDPYVPTIKDGWLFGRGAADMKGSLAAMVVAIEHLFEKATPQHGTISFLLTSDEEGPALHGTKHVVEQLLSKGIRPDACLVGEPTSKTQLGDVVRIGRRGSLTGELTILGKQGHVAYPHLALNPIHQFSHCLQELVNHKWDSGYESFPATSWQAVHIEAGAGATNVIPDKLKLLFNFRFAPCQTEYSLKQTFINILKKHQLRYELDWSPCQPTYFSGTSGRLLEVAISALKKIAKINPELSTGGGTSDGRFIAKLDTEILELGPSNATIHQANECVSVQELITLTELYQEITSTFIAKIANNT